MTIDRVWLRTFFMVDYLIFKSSLIFFHSVLMLPYYFLDITLKVLRSKYVKTIKMSIEQVDFSKGFFKYVVKTFTVTLFQNTISWFCKWLGQTCHGVRVLAQALQLV